MKCKQCGHEFETNAKFCPDCGAKQEKNCVSCGANLNPDARFCSECGTKVNFKEEAGSSTSSKALMSIPLSPLPLDLPACNIEINEINAEGPNEDGDLRITVKYTVTNKTQENWEYLDVRSQILNAAGAIMDETRDNIELNIGSGESTDCEINFWGVKARPFGDQIDQAHVVMSVTACGIELRNLGEVEIPEESYSPTKIEPAKLGEEIQLISGSLWKTDLDDDQDCQIQLRALVQNLTKKNFPEVRVLAEIQDKNGREIADASTYDEVRPGSVALMSGSSYAKGKQLNGAKVDLTLRAYGPVAAGVAQHQGMIIEAHTESSEHVGNIAGKNIGYSISISAALVVKFNDPKVTPEEGHFYIRQFKTSSENIPDIFSVSLGRVAQAKGLLLAETWEDNLTFDYSSWENGTWRIDVNGSLIVEPVNQSNGVIDQSEERYWANLLLEGHGDIASLEIEKRSNGDASPDSMQIISLEYGSIDDVAMVFYSDDEVWEEVKGTGYLTNSDKVNSEAKNTSLYLRVDSSGDFDSSIAYGVFNRNDGSTFFRGAYFGYAGGGEYEGGFFFIDLEKDQHRVFTFDEIESLDDKAIYNDLMSICGQCSADDEPSNLTDDAIEMLEHFGEDADDGCRVCFINGFDGDIISEISEKWNISLRFSC